MRSEDMFKELLDRLCEAEAARGNAEARMVSSDSQLRVAQSELDGMTKAHANRRDEVGRLQARVKVLEHALTNAGKELPAVDSPDIPF